MDNTTRKIKELISSGNKENIELGKMLCESQGRKDIWHSFKKPYFELCRFLLHYTTSVKSIEMLTGVFTIQYFHKQPINFITKVCPFITYLHVTPRCKRLHPQLHLLPHLRIIDMENVTLTSSCLKVIKKTKSLKGISISRSRQNKLYLKQINKLPILIRYLP